MYVPRSLSHSFAAAATLLIGASSSLFAQRSTERELFSWSGPVDREVRIAMRANDVWSKTLDRGLQGQDRSRVLSSLPRNDGNVTVRVLNGRGNVDVMQQPSSANDYTAIIRIRDDAGGSDSYRLAAYWASNGYGVGDSRYPRVEDRSRDDRGYGRDDRGNNGRGNGGYGNGGYGNGNGNGRDRDGRYNNGSLHWAGAVDGTTEIRVRQRDINYRTLSGNRPRDVQTQVNGAPLMSGNQTVELRDARGRGQVVVVQQPSRDNDYTAVIRVTDPQSGYGRYDFDVVWR